MDLVAPTVDAPAGIVEDSILGEDLVDGRAPTRGVVLAEDVVKIAGQQGQYAMGHGLSPLLERAHVDLGATVYSCVLCRRTHRGRRNR